MNASPSLAFLETREGPGRIEGNPLSQVWFGVTFNVTATEELRSQTSRASHPAVQPELGQLQGPYPPARAPHPTLMPEKRRTLQCPSPTHWACWAKGDLSHTQL